MDFLSNYILVYSHTGSWESHFTCISEMEVYTHNPWILLSYFVQFSFALIPGKSELLGLFKWVRKNVDSKCLNTV
jgi:hypothetical protein